MKQSQLEDEGRQNLAADAEQYEALTAELQQYDTIYQLQSNIITVLSKHQLHLSGAIERYRQKVLGKIESSLMHETNEPFPSSPSHIQQGEEDGGLGKRSLISWLKNQNSKNPNSRAPTSEKGIQVCTSQPELALGLGSVTHDPLAPVVRQSKNIIQSTTSGSSDPTKAGIVPENKETVDEYVLRKQISEVFKLVSFARGSQADKSGDPGSSSKKPSQGQYNSHLGNSQQGHGRQA